MSKSVLELLDLGIFVEVIFFNFAVLVLCYRVLVIFVRRCSYLMYRAGKLT